MSSWGGKYDKSDDPESDSECSEEVGVEAPRGIIYGDCESVVLRSMLSKSRSKGPASFPAEESINLEIAGGQRALTPSKT
jgi:hypothetical protein